jgi:hypothetical protein
MRNRRKTSIAAIGTVAGRTGISGTQAASPAQPLCATSRLLEQAQAPSKARDISFRFGPGAVWMFLAA